MDSLRRQSRGRQIGIGCGCAFLAVVLLLLLLVAYLLSPFFSFGP